MYCERCRRLAEDGRCPDCGRRKLRLPEPEDFCLLSAPEPMWAQALEDLLKDNGIACVTRNIFNIVQVRMASLPECVRFFVRYRDYQKARELCDAFFNAEFAFAEQTDGLPMLDA